MKEEEFLPVEIVWKGVSYFPQSKEEARALMDKVIAEKSESGGE